MSSYVKYYKKHQEFLRWWAKKWAEAVTSGEISSAVVSECCPTFNELAVRFGLIKEFRKYGLI